MIQQNMSKIYREKRIRRKSEKNGKKAGKKKKMYNKS